MEVTIDRKRIEEIKMETVQKRLMKWRMSKDRPRRITCPVCGHRGETFSVYDNGREITGRCESCCVAGKIDSVDFPEELQSLNEKYKRAKRNLEQMEKDRDRLDYEIYQSEKKIKEMEYRLYQDPVGKEWKRGKGFDKRTSQSGK
ncbi:MAG: hypothetical protein ACOX60_06200 [Massiliimalia sp.]|jgi:transcription elongation factor Elf1